MFTNSPGPYDRHGQLPQYFPRILVTLTAVCGLGLVSRATEPNQDRERQDVMLARAAIHAVHSDPRSQDLHLIISVVDRVAVIGGAVPTKAHGQEIADRIRQQVPGILEVKNRCYLSVRPDPLLSIMTASRTIRQPFPVDLPSLLPGSQDEATVEPIMGSVEGGVANAAPGEMRVVARRLANPVDHVLLAPIPFTEAGVSNPASVSPVPPPPLTLPIWSPTLPTPGAIVGRTPDVLSAAEAIRKADTRFSGLRLDLKEGTLTIAGSAARGADAWDLAQSLRVVPGVERVALGQVEVR